MRPRAVHVLTTLAVALIALFSSTALASAHPLHTSLAEIVYDPASKELHISLRVFVDDLSKASAAYAKSKAAAMKGARPAAAESPLLAYARAWFLISDRGGRPLSLASCGGKQVGDLMWLCFHAPAPSGPVGFQVANRMLFDLYSDQINIVQAVYSGKKVSLLFTRGEGLKRLE